MNELKFTFERVQYSSKKTGEQKQYPKITLNVNGIDFELSVKGELQTLMIFRQLVDMWCPADKIVCTTSEVE